MHAAAATLDKYGSWKVKKKRQSQKIEGLVATVIAHALAARESRRKHVAPSW